MIEKGIRYNLNRVTLHVTKRNCAAPVFAQALREG
jgi:hypothetical protein